MKTTLSMLMVAAALAAGCSPSMPGEAKSASGLLDESGPDQDTCSAAPGKGALVVEGFGSRNETQLIVTERQPAARCLRGSPARTATLSPAE